MTGIPPKEVTRLLSEWSSGDRTALDRLMSVVYRELHRLARGYLRDERPGHTLQTTALVHEAYVRLVDQERIQWQNRAQFFGVAAGMMRRVLIDHSRMHRRAKRGGGAVRVSLDEAEGICQEQRVDLIALDDALTALSAVDPRKGRTVELRYFGGLSVEETAEVLQVSVNTVVRDWNVARAWLYRELTRESPVGS
jgi:RNA polymerase sigma-70 factor, ECF subfamily